MKKDFKKSLIDDIVSVFLKKFGDFVFNYIGKSQISKDIQGSVKRTLKDIIKREIRKYTLSILSVIVIIIGMMFLMYGIIAAVLYLLELPLFLTNIIFGFVLLIIGLIISLTK